MSGRSAYVEAQALVPLPDGMTLGELTTALDLTRATNGAVVGVVDASEDQRMSDSSPATRALRLRWAMPVFLSDRPES